MRKLVSVQKIVDVQPIEGADLICKYKINGWWVVDGVGKYQVGDLVLYYEIDSFLPIREEFEFLRKSSYKMLVDGTEGFRLRSVRLRKQLSQGLITSTAILGDVVVTEGDDVSDLLGVTKYEPPIPACLAGLSKGSFPGYLVKTDETRIQSFTDADYEYFKTVYGKFHATEKLNGSSCSISIRGNEFVVCSRNMNLVETEGNSFWRVAREQNIEQKMRDYNFNFAIQGELIGEGIQGNPYKIRGVDFYIFNMYDIDNAKFLSQDYINEFSKNTGIKTVPYLGYEELPKTIEECLTMAEGKSILHSSAEREGIVFKSQNREVSFKAISNKFLLGEK